MQREIQNILKEHQELCDANNRELYSIRLELVKSDNATLLKFF